MLNLQCQCLMIRVVLKRCINMLNYDEICRKIYQATRHDSIVVFGIKGDVFYFKQTEKIKFNRMIKDFPKSLVGIYDKRCTLKMIQEDIL